MILGARGSCKKHRVIDIPLFQTSKSSLLQDGDLGNDKDPTCVIFSTSVNFLILMDSMIIYAQKEGVCGAA